MECFSKWGASWMAAIGSGEPQKKGVKKKSNNQKIKNIIQLCNFFEDILLDCVLIIEVHFSFFCDFSK